MTNTTNHLNTPEALEAWAATLLNIATTSGTAAHRAAVVSHAGSLLARAARMRRG